MQLAERGGRDRRGAMPRGLGGGTVPALPRRRRLRQAPRGAGGADGGADGGAAGAGGCRGVRLLDVTRPRARAVVRRPAPLPPRERSVRAQCDSNMKLQRNSMMPQLAKLLVPTTNRSD